MESYLKFGLLSIIVVLLIAGIYAFPSITGFVPADDPPGPALNAPTGLSASVCCQSTITTTTTLPVTSECSDEECIESTTTNLKKCCSDILEEACKNSCMSEADCGAIRGYKITGMCPGLGYVPGFTRSQVCCRAGTLYSADTDSVIEFSTIILSESATELYGTFSGIGVVNIFDLSQIIRTNSRISDIQFTTSVLRTIQSNIRAGISVDKTINIYKGYYDPVRKDLNDAGFTFVGQKLQKIIDDYRDLCDKLRGLTIDEVPKDLIQVSDSCRYPENIITSISVGLRNLEKSTIEEFANADKNALITAIRNFDSKAKSGQVNKDDYAEVYFQLGEYLKGKNDGKAIEMYSAVVDGYPTSPRVSSAKSNIESLKNFKPVVFVKIFIISSVGDFTPTPSLSILKPLGKPLGFVGRILGRNKYADDVVIDVAKRNGMNAIDAPEYARLSRKVVDGTATDTDRLALSNLIRKTGTTALRLSDQIPELKFLSSVDGYELWKAAENSEAGARWIVFVDIDGVKQPFYKSAEATGGKIGGPGSWHPFFGFTEDFIGYARSGGYSSKGWFVKFNGDPSTYGLNGAKFQEISEKLNNLLPGEWKIGDIRRTDLTAIVNDARSVSSIGSVSFNSKLFGKQITNDIQVYDQLGRAYGIPKARNFDELNYALDAIGNNPHEGWRGLQGTQEFYTSTELKQTISHVRAGRLASDYIPRTGGLRAKVEELLAKGY